MTSYDHNTDAETIRRVLAERHRQVSGLGYTPEADDDLSLLEWGTKLHRYYQLTADAVASSPSNVTALREARWRMVELSATAVAGVSAMDRHIERLLQAELEANVDDPECPRCSLRRGALLGGLCGTCSDDLRMEEQVREEEARSAADRGREAQEDEAIRD
jgi:hypothetical protein